MQRDCFLRCVNVTGAASLAGTVEVKLINGFMPQDGDDMPNAEATGLALEDVDFGLALIEPTAGQSKVAGLE